MMAMKYVPIILLAAILSISCRILPAIGESVTVPAPIPRENLAPNIRRILDHARQQTKITTGYSQEYFVIGYPNGDPPAETGACTDVVVRAFRAADVDLQKEVHLDMSANFSKYPSKWGLKTPDTNIDHRRVPNLQTFFTRRGKSVPVTRNSADYQPGDVVTWNLDGKGMTHIGLVSDIWNETTGRFYIIHNMGWGTRVEDRLFEWQLTGHYRFF